MTFFFFVRCQSYKASYLPPPLTLQDAHLCAQCSVSQDALPVASSSQLAQTLVIRELQKKDGMTGSALASVSEESESGLGR